MWRYTRALDTHDSAAFIKVRGVVPIRRNAE